MRIWLTICFGMAISTTKMLAEQEKEKKNCPEDELFRIGLTALAVAFLLAVLYQCALKKIFPVVPCFFRTFAGMYCPGCGGTRALKALLQGHFLRAVWYHPFIPYSAVIFLGFLLTQGLHRIGFKKIKGWRFHNWYLWVGAAIIAVNFVLKNILLLRFGIALETILLPRR